MQQPFEGVLGNSSELRLLEFLLPLQDIEFNVTEISQEVEVSRVTATRIIKKFVANKILKQRRVGSITYYSINVDSPIVETVKRLNIVLIESLLGDEKLYEIHDYLVSHQPSATPLIGPEPVGETGWKVQRGYPSSPMNASVIDGTASAQNVPHYWSFDNVLKRVQEVVTPIKKIPLSPVPSGAV